MVEEVEYMIHKIEKVMQKEGIEGELDFNRRSIPDHWHAHWRS